MMWLRKKEGTREGQASFCTREIRSPSVASEGGSFVGAQTDLGAGSKLLDDQTDFPDNDALYL